MKTITIQIPDNCEVQIVRKEEKKNSVIRTYQNLIDNEVVIRGAYIGLDSKIFSIYDTADKNNMNVAASEKIAKSMLAMAMISQLMPYYGGEITDKEWKDTLIDKYSITSIGKVITAFTTKTMYYYLSFHTSEQRDEFLKYNERLVKDYLMID